MHAEAEIRWHDELDATLAAPGGEAPAGSLGGGSFEVAAPRRTALEVVGAAAEEPSGGRAPAEPARDDGTADAGEPRRGRPTTRREKPRQ